MQSDIPAALAISEPPPERWGEVARFLFAPRSGSASACETVEAASDSASHASLLEARRGNQTVGAVWGRILADGTAEVVPPRICAPESEETARVLLRTLEGRLATGQVHAAFVYLPSDDSSSFDMLRHTGYQFVGEMLVMASTIADDSTPPTDQLLSLQQYHASRRRDLLELVNRTYVDTLDFPALSGLRHQGDILARYADTGDSGTTHWWFVRSGDCDVGCLLLADYPQRDRCEMVYTGLVPEARGNGWGHKIVALALRTAREIGRAQMVLGVDAHNDPAISVYASAGFIEQHRRSVLSKLLGSVTA